MGSVAYARSITRREPQADAARPVQAMLVVGPAVTGRRSPDLGHL